MLRRIEQHNASQPPAQKIRVSVEVEKPREELFQLFGYGDVVSGPRSFPLPHPAHMGGFLYIFLRLKKKKVFT